MGKRIQITESQLNYIIKNANRIDEQDKSTTNVEQGSKFSGGGGKTAVQKEKKVTDADISNLGKGIMSKDIKEVLAAKKASIPNEQANALSAAFIDKAMTDKSYKKLFKTGLINDSLTLVAKDGYPGNSEYNGALPSKTLKIQSVGGDKKSPDLTVYLGSVEKSKTFATDDEISKYVNDLNIALFKSDEDSQYYLYAMKDGKLTKGYQGDAFLLAKKPAIAGTTKYVNIVGPSTERGGSTDGTSTPGGSEKIPVDFTIKITEPFGVESFDLDNPEQSKKVLVDKINNQLTAKGINGLEISEINVISSASNSWGKKWVTPTHKGNSPYKSGDTDLSNKQIVNVSNNFNSKPSGPGNEGKNNVLAWNRGGTIGNLVKSVNGVNGIDTQSAKINIQWRVTDTKGQTDEQLGKVGLGQYAIIQIKGVGTKTETTLPKETPGSSLGVISQRLIYLTAGKAKGGRRTISWFSGHKAKYIGSGGKFLAKPRTAGGISGLPDWLDKIIGYQ